ncbi:dienelactone hydrolase [Sphaerosporella brunnea]|uniref:Dienelactone hydrolase n=1 Tax=Sphaerosporella brunnea TaxID=1250544 RepID=A0A5J5EP72_9PEZI|nr:dienelactone hydrolase [Sphaerosporella brunnea]
MTSKACCTIPAVVSSTDDYVLKGEYTTLDGMRTYVTGAAAASKTGVLAIHDVFGLDYWQTLQGADIVASTGRVVVMPDFFRGAVFEPSIIPADTEEKMQKMVAFLDGPANFENNTEAVKALVPLLKERFPGVEKWALLGYCWGGKVATLLSLEGSLFAASAQVHPARLDPEEAKKLTIPHLCIATNGEDADTVQKFKEAVEANEGIAEKSEVVRWEGTFHGFMAARVDLKEKEHLEYYEKGYKKVVQFLKATLV